MKICRASNFSVSFERVNLYKIFGNKDLINRIGAVFVSSKDSSSDLGREFISISPLHGRACTTIYEGKTITLKGVGWTFGGPKYFLSPTLEELYYGLLPEIYAKKEMKISKALEKENILAGRVIGYGLLGNDFAEITVQDELFKPSILYTQMSSPYRIADLMYFDLMQRQSLFRNEYVRCNPDLENSSLESIFWDFLETLSKTNHTLINLGGINDSLFWDNVTLAGEVVDFEYIFLPGLGVNDSIGHIRLQDRQKQSFIWLFELLFKMVHALQLKISFSEIAIRSFEACKEDLLKENKSFLEGFLREN